LDVEFVPHDIWRCLATWFVSFSDRLSLSHLQKVWGTAPLPSATCGSAGHCQRTHS
jgi:hypothetical protein